MDFGNKSSDKPYFFLNEMNEKDLPAMYSTAFWCLFVVLLFFFLALLRNRCYSFLEVKAGHFDLSGLDQSQQECRFLRRNSNPLQIFQLRLKWETYYRVRGVSLIKFTYFDSCLVFFDFDILSLIKEKNIFGFSVSF